jgi:hypothetical protein
MLWCVCVCVCVCPFQILNKLTDFYEAWNAEYATVWHHSTLYFDFLLSVITSWQKQNLWDGSNINDINFGNTQLL